MTLRGSLSQENIYCWPLITTFWNILGVNVRSKSSVSSDIFASTWESAWRANSLWFAFLIYSNIKMLIITIKSLLGKRFTVKLWWSCTCGDVSDKVYRQTILLLFIIIVIIYWVHRMRNQKSFPSVFLCSNHHCGGRQRQEEPGWLCRSPGFSSGRFCVPWCVFIWCMGSNRRRQEW